MISMRRCGKKISDLRRRRHHHYQLEYRQHQDQNVNLLLTMIRTYHGNDSRYYDPGGSSLSQSHHCQRQPSNVIKRNLAIYACGEGWTGALGKDHLCTSIVGHYDEEFDDVHTGDDVNDDIDNDVDDDDGRQFAMERKNSSNLDNRDDQSGRHRRRRLPSLLCLHPGDDVKQVSVGWSTTAYLDTQGHVYIVGKPHDLMNMLRMARMPQMIRNFIIRNSGISRSSGGNSDDGGDLVNATFVGKAISDIIGWATGTSATSTAVPDDADLDPTDQIWAVAQEYSWLKAWKKIDLRTMSKRITKDTHFSHVVCGPGMTALIGKDSGILYMMGANNRGQCGVGRTTNNVWVPEQVQGISARAPSSVTSSAPTKGQPYHHHQQDTPVVQVALGFQHGVALTQDGQVFTWGKGNRGQLGRPMRDNDQDAVARPITIPSSTETVTNVVPMTVQIGTGHHHGALLTDDNRVFIWGKNMSRGESDTRPDEDGVTKTAKTTSRESLQKPADAMVPEQVLGLPLSADSNNDYNDNSDTEHQSSFVTTSQHKRVLQITCGSHHTSILLEDGSVYALGIASDVAVPLLDPVELIPSGILQMPVRFFEAHFDRTTVIDRDGHVYQAHLWNDETLREFAYFTPAYVNELKDCGEDIQALHRGWKHTVVVSTRNTKS